MSQAMEHTASACDRLLDYVYGELSGEDLEQFKLHLLGCEKCKRELAGLERVRSAVKQAMPPLEPPVDKMAAMHAQLMHAAAQQKPKRGKVLMFARRVVSHPAYAAAAVLVLVAGTLTVNWSMGRLNMAAPEAVHEEVSTPVVAAPAAAPTAPAGGALVKQEQTKVVETYGKDVAAKEPKIVLNTEPGAYTVRAATAGKKEKSAPADDALRGAEGYSSGKGSGGAYGNRSKLDEGGAKKRAHATSGLEIAKNDEQAEMPAARPASPPVAKPVVAAKSAPARPAETKPEPAKPEPPKTEVARRDAPPPPPAQVAKERETTIVASGDVAGQDGRAANQAPMRQSSASSMNQAGPVGNSAPAAAAPPPQPAPSLADSKTGVKNTLDNNNVGNARHQQKAQDPVAAKKQFLSYAQSNRCAEAIKLYQDLDAKTSGLFNKSDNLKYVDCLRQMRQNELADNEARRFDEEQKVNASRATKKPSKAKPADAPALMEPASK